MNKLELKSKFKNIITKVESQLDHIWTNLPRNESKFKNIITKVELQLDHIWTNLPKNESKLGVSETYWLGSHKPIYMVFKLPNTLPIYSNKLILAPFI
jgi:hypothetical protein